MENSEEHFEVGIEFDSVLRAISKQIYDTPFAFVRENLQNAIDATRIQAQHQGIPPDDASLRIDISVTDTSISIRDRGNGMSADDLRNLYWTIGASGKRSDEARAAGCVGMFGIGGFANLGVCETLVVVSQIEGGPGHRTALSRSDIGARVGLPMVLQQLSDRAAPRGTIVEGILEVQAVAQELQQYAREIVQYCGESIYFDGDLISGEQPRIVQQGLSPVRSIQGPQTWSHDGVEVTAELYELPGGVVGATLQSLLVKGRHAYLSGALRFEGSGIDILKKGFRLCSSTVATRIGVSGIVDCELLSPTAGRDSLDAESHSLLTNIVAAMEHAAVLAVLESSDLIDQHTRIFRYIRSNGLTGRIENVRVQTAQGRVLTLADVKRRTNEGSRAYLATTPNDALTNVLQARGHVVITLPGDRHKAATIRDYLSSFGASELSGHVECKERYADLSRFEKAFLSELSETIGDVYQVPDVQLTAGSLTEDIPVMVASESPPTARALDIYVDTRHPEVSKLAQLGMTSLFRSMVSAFCREYLGPTLRLRSPKFFGSGAVNLDWLAQNRSEAWILLTDEIAVVDRAVRRQVVTTADIQVVSTSPDVAPAPEDNAEPKLVRIEGASEFESLEGYYLRVPNAAAAAYGDVIIDCDDRGAVWMGSRILLVASDAISTAFHFEITLDHLLVEAGSGVLSQGAVVVERPIQQLFGGLYFPIPRDVESHLVPVGDQKILIKVLCDWLDFAGSRGWEARDAG